MKHILIAVVFLLVFGCGLQNQVPQDQTTNTDTDKNSKKDPNDAITSDKAAKLTDPDCADPDLSKVLVGVKFMKCDGSIGEGQMPEPLQQPDLKDLLPQNIKVGIIISGITGTYQDTVNIPCITEGQVNCSVGGKYVAVSTTSLVPSKIALGVTTAGVTGTYAGPYGKCLNNGLLNCVTTENYRSADISNLLPENIKSGTIIAGVTGNYASYPSCSDNSQTNCLTNTTYKSANLTNLSASNIKSGVEIAGVSGNITPESHTNCNDNGQQGCITTATFKAADISNLVPGNVKTGVAIAGISGNVIQESHTNCTDNNQQGCITTAAFRSASFTNLVASNIKKDAIVAGVTGIYPSSSALLIGATGTADLDLATFDAKIKSASDFEWFDAAGNRYQRGGSATIVEENIKSGVAIFGLTGTLSTDAPDPWDVRKDVVVGTTTGQANMKCRNRSGVAPAADKCYGESYQDITHSGSTTCSVYPADCMIKDRISGLIWTKSGGQKTWANANSYCTGLVVNAVSGWRLAEKEELQRAYIQGISNGTTGLIVDGNIGYWSGTSGSTGRWMIRLVDTGLTSDVDSSSATPGTICVK